MDDKHSIVVPDAIPFNFPTNTTEAAPVNALDSIMNELSLDDFKSIFFLLLNTIGISDYLYLIKQDKKYLKEKFLEKYYEFPYKEPMLIEILGTMQKFNLLELLQTCQHVFKIEKESLTHIHPLWKCLYSVCEELSDAQVTELKRKLFPNSSIVITCAEQLFCEALQAHVFEVNDLKNLADVFQNYPECYNLITSYKKKAKLSFYPIKMPTAESPCGQAVIVCQNKFRKENDNCPHLTDRPDSCHDAYALRNLWNSFGFKTTIHNDLTDKEVMDLFKSLSAFDHSPYDAFIACFLSHGDKGVVFASNCKPIAIGDLIDIMANNCPSLVCKPKLFFVQACQGRLVQEGIFNHTIEKEQVSRNLIDLSYSKLCRAVPIFTDVLLVISSIEGYASFYTPGRNSWFIGDLVQVMNEDGDDLTVFNIITKVIDLVAQKSGVTEDGKHRNCKQTTVTNSTLRYELKLKRLRCV